MILDVRTPEEFSIGHLDGEDITSVSMHGIKTIGNFHFHMCFALPLVFFAALWPWQWCLGMQGSFNIPMQTLGIMEANSDVRNLSLETTLAPLLKRCDADSVYVVCRTGHRSGIATPLVSQFVRDHGRRLGLPSGKLRSSTMNG